MDRDREHSCDNMHFISKTGAAACYGPGVKRSFVLKSEHARFNSNHDENDEHDDNNDFDVLNNGNEESPSALEDTIDALLDSPTPSDNTTHRRDTIILTRSRTAPVVRPKRKTQYFMIIIAAYYVDNPCISALVCFSIETY